MLQNIPGTTNIFSNDRPEPLRELNSQGWPPTWLSGTTPYRHELRMQWVPLEHAMAAWRIHYALWSPDTQLKVILAIFMGASAQRRVWRHADTGSLEWGTGYVTSVKPLLVTVLETPAWRSLPIKMHTCWYPEASGIGAETSIRHRTTSGGWRFTTRIGAAHDDPEELDPPHHPEEGWCIPCPMLLYCWTSRWETLLVHRSPTRNTTTKGLFSLWVYEDVGSVTVAAAAQGSVIREYISIYIYTYKYTYCKNRSNRAASSHQQTSAQQQTAHQQTSAQQQTS